MGWGGGGVVVIFICVVNVKMSSSYVVKIKIRKERKV